MVFLLHLPDSMVTKAKELPLSYEWENEHWAPEFIWENEIEDADAELKLLFAYEWENQHWAPEFEWEREGMHMTDNEVGFDSSELTEQIQLQDLWERVIIQENLFTAEDMLLLKNTADWLSHQDNKIFLRKIMSYEHDIKKITTTDRQQYDRSLLFSLKSYLKRLFLMWDFNLAHERKRRDELQSNFLAV